jgi:hypothetical protein
MVTSDEWRVTGLIRAMFTVAFEWLDWGMKRRAGARGLPGGWMVRFIFYGWIKSD